MAGRSLRGQFKRRRQKPGLWHQEEPQCWLSKRDALRGGDFAEPRRWRETKGQGHGIGSRREVLLRKLPMMAGLDGNSYAELLGCAELSRVSGRTVLYWEDQPASGVYFLITGSVELFSKSGSRKVSLWVLEPPVVLSIAPVFGMSSCPFSVRTLEDSEFVMLPCDEVRRLAMRDPAFATRAAEELATRYVESIQRLKTQFLKYGVERVADFLLDEWERQGRKATFRLPIEKHTLASTLGLANESLSRLFAMLRRIGIDVVGQDVCVGNVDELRRIAGRSQALQKVARLKHGKGRDVPE